MEEETAADFTIQKKHQAMLDRLSNRHQNRTTKSTAATSATTTASLLSKFTESKNSIESQLSDTSNLTAATTDPSLIKSHLLNISSSISSLEQLIAENSYILPSYELRFWLKTVSDLKQSLENLNSNLIPKKKFSFKNKPASSPKPETNRTEIPKTETPNQNPLIIRDSPGIRGKENEILTHNFNCSPAGEFTLQNLDSCEVRLIGCVNAIFINNLRNCKVYGGPVVGSILIEGVEDCVFVLASHQIRIHYAKGSDFYLRVRSRPIIEDCGGVRFGPYCLRYEGVEDDLKRAGLEEESGNWSNVDDFKWLRAAQSPNWCVLEENERIGVVELKELGCGN
ncbi:tubulin-folding cofactor C [Mercurialis annua]|uniref:tubulin-folding cofactor C n=1 Tax=Mercurialis annua TaxID=3986 RepID=UPI00215FC144|nr:tubulin-folding cofactor C [Mercurialis annua]XP_050206909.1 tubulin-folding cofactor C [Mercurialis annua]XP_055959635.1 tubulin-folding cofactor C [Mercurialis annua]XP_055959636.1 tubulin-folding cofactor C [Mercurialis annua]XP_055959637.1 tubulin-folding cofactor C [Mercurialis annua]XP_055959638.1 tubulin-folding cofactor C [Mercurialis annua]